MSAVSESYAVALISIGKDKKCLQEIFDDMENLEIIFNEHEEFIKYLDDHRVDIKKRKAKLSEFLTGINQYVLIFLYLLIESHNIKKIKEIIVSFVEFAQVELNMIVGKIISKIKLDQQAIKKIEKKLEDKYQKKAKLFNHVNSEFIGGFKVVISESTIDATLNTNLLNLKKQVLEKGEI